MPTSQKAKYLLDGKPVYSFLFARVVTLPSGRRDVPMTYQVEGFDKDHAYKRLLENEPGVPRREFEFIDALEPEHDVGYLGKKLPMFPHGVAGTMTRQ